MKQRFTTADVSAEVACLRAHCLGMRVSNIYDISPRIYLFKLARSGEDGQKVYLLMESGTRFHTTQVLKDRPPQPSNYCLKLRKHIRTQRLEDVHQLGVDRIVDFTFGTGAATHHVLLELYSAGNLILTDGRYEVMTLLRSHRDDARGMATLPGHPYPLKTIRLDKAISLEELTAIFKSSDADATLQGVLNSALPYGPQVTDHCLLSAGLQPTARLSDSALGQQQLSALQAALDGYRAWVASLDKSVPTGSIGLAKPGESRKQRAAAAAAAAASGQPPPASQQTAVEDLVYDDYEPLMMKQHEGRPRLNFPTFDAALAEFYSKVEGQRAGVQQAAAKKQVLSKLDKARADQAERVAALGREADAEEDQASLIEYNMSAVDAAIDALNAALARGLDWRDLATLIANEKAAGNPVAKTVAELRLERNAAVLLLCNELDLVSDSDDEGLGAPPPPPTRVEVDLSMNAAANARVHHEARKRHTSKQQRTADAANLALAAAEKKTAAQLAQVEKKAAALTMVRKPAWFEKFQWFVSSENFLVISGRDAQQTDLLVNRHLREGDVFVHADLKGALPTIVKNNEPALPIPPLTISQAGAACVCHSSAWGAKIVTSAWWVPASQVTRASPSVDSLPAGNFTVRGTRCYLPPTPLIMGLGFLFLVDDASAAAHRGERTVRSGDAVADAPVDGEHEEPPDPTTKAAEKSDAASSDSDFKSESDSHSQSQNADELQQNDAADQLSDSPSDTASQGRSDQGSLSSATASRPSQQNECSSPAHLEERPANSSADVAVDDVNVPSLEDARNGVSSAGRAHPGVQQVSSDPAVSSDMAASQPTAVEKSMSPSADPCTTDSFSRYGLRDQSASSTAGATAAVAAPEVVKGGSGARHMSAAERRAAKKMGLAPGVAAPAEPETSAADMPEATPSLHALKGAGRDTEEAGGKRHETKQQATASPPQARGARQKARKAARLYAQQDEEDRKLAMAALASAGSKKVKGDRKEARKARRQARRPPDSAPSPLPTADELVAVNARPIDARRTWIPHSGKAANNSAPAAAGAHNGAQPEVAGGGGPRPKHPSADDSNAPRDELSGRQTASDSTRSTPANQTSDEQLAKRDAEDRARLTDLLRHMTGAPREGDTLECALPVCAPYQVLASYRYRAKLTPGGQKKGKAARQVAAMLANAHGVPQRHADAIRCVPEAETIAACIGGVKLSIAGLQAAKQAAKKSKKLQK